MSRHLKLEQEAGVNGLCCQSTAPSPGKGVLHVMSPMCILSAEVERPAWLNLPEERPRGRETWANRARLRQTQCTRDAIPDAVQHPRRGVRQVGSPRTFLPWLQFIKRAFDELDGSREHVCIEAELDPGRPVEFREAECATQRKGAPVGRQRTL